MANVLQRYHDFLQEKEIYDFADLIIELVGEPYLIIPSMNDKYTDLIMLNVSEETDLNEDITDIFDGLIINKLNIKNIVVVRNFLAGY